MQLKADSVGQSPATVPPTAAVSLAMPDARETEKPDACSSKLGWQQRGKSEAPAVATPEDGPVEGLKCRCLIHWGHADGCLHISTVCR